MPQQPHLRSIAPIDDTEVEPLDDTVEAVAEEAIQPDAAPLPIFALQYLPLDLLRRLDAAVGIFQANGESGYGTIRVDMAKGKPHKLFVEQSFLLG